MSEVRIDLRAAAAGASESLAFCTFDELELGETLELMSDLDSKILMAHFEAERPQEFIWENLEEGPALWRVRVGRIRHPERLQVEEGCCGICSSD